MLGAPACLLGAKPAVMRAGCQTSAWPVDPKDLESFFKALAAIKELGFEGFETDFFNVRSQFTHADGPRERIKKSGLRFSGIHVWLNAYDQQTAIPSVGLLEQVADGCKALGAERLIVSGASTFHPLALRGKADGLTRIAKYCKDIGIGCAYHPHDYDFQEGGTQINGLVGMADPGVQFEVEARAGVEEFFAKNWRRIDGIHLPLDQGEPDWEPLKKAIADSQWKGWLMVADERQKGGEVGPAREALRKVFGV